MLTRDSLRSAFCRIGMPESAANKAAGVCTALQIDNFLACRRAEIEELLSEFVENAHLCMRGVVSLDQVVRSANALNSMLDSLSTIYTFCPHDISSSVRSVRDEIGAVLRWA